MAVDVIIVGPIPPPVGGVSTFISRLTSSLKLVKDIIIYDLYPANKKYNVEGIKYIPVAFWGPMWVRQAVLSIKLYFNACDIVYFNYSTARSVIATLFFFKRPRQRWLLTLHSGDVCKNLPSSLDFIIRRAMNRFDRVAVLSQQQRAYFERLSIKCELISLKPYIPPAAFNDYQRNESTHVAESLLNKFGKLIVTSGYPLADYNFNVVIDYAVSRRLGLVVCVYGLGDINVANYLKNAEKEYENIRVFFGLNENDFNDILRCASVYVRPTNVDSFGIAVADAIAFGVPAIASNVCERSDGCVVYEHPNLAEFKKILDQIIVSGNFEKKCLLNNSHERFFQPWLKFLAK